MFNWLLKILRMVDCCACVKILQRLNTDKYWKSDWVWWIIKNINIDRECTQARQFFSNQRRPIVLKSTDQLGFADVWDVFRILNSLYCCESKSWATYQLYCALLLNRGEIWLLKKKSILYLWFCCWNCVNFPYLFGNRSKKIKDKDKWDRNSTRIRLF